MTAKCGKRFKNIWDEEFSCSRNKGHHGDHTYPILRDWGRQKFWHTEKEYNYDRYCGASFTGSHARCERKPGHKLPYHKSWFYTQYISWKLIK